MITGECFCGEIKYAISGELSNARSCHCSRCRKVFSSQASAYAEVKSDEFKWLSGEEKLTIFKSQKDFGLCFCSKCGSTLCGLYKGKVHGVTLGCVNGDPDVKLGMHIFVGSKASWESLPEDDVPMFKEGPIKN